MANTKISALTSATTPLAGTETLPVVQSSTTKQVTVANLTAGRLVSAGALAVGQTTVTSGSIVQINGALLASNVVTALDLTNLGVQIGGGGSVATGASQVAGIYADINGFGGASDLIIRPRSDTSPGAIRLYTGSGGGTEKFKVDTSGNATLSIGNLIPNTAGKGINFTANTPAAGMTSQLLNWYEEGTWTPNQGSGLTLIGAFSSTGKYTRVGREVIVSGTVTGATSVALVAAGIITTNLPFTVGTAGHGNVTNAALTSFAAIICTSTNVTSAGAIAATGTLTFSATYFI